jgi:hypothetical protein
MLANKTKIAMVQRKFIPERSVVSLMEELRQTRSKERAIGLLHLLGDLKIGKRKWGWYNDFATEVGDRIRHVIERAWGRNPFFGDKSSTTIVDKDEREVSQKVLRVLCSLLQGITDRCKYATRILCELPLEFLNYYTIQWTFLGTRGMFRVKICSWPGVR